MKLKTNLFVKDKLGEQFQVRVSGELPVAADFSEGSEVPKLRGGVMRVREGEVTCKHQSEMDRR